MDVILVYSIALWIFITQEHILFVGRSGSWWSRRDAGAFYRDLDVHPSWTVGGYGTIMVLGGSNDLLAYSNIICTFLHWDRTMQLGRIRPYMCEYSGRWMSMKPAGVFFRDLLDLPSASNTYYGAYTVVTGGSSGLLVRSTVICTILPCGRLLSLGR